MTAADASSWIAFLEGSTGEDVRLLDRALEDRQIVMVPVVLKELLSDASLPSNVVKAISDLPLLELAKRRKARLGDALIAQSCIDQSIPLITRDRDFRAFAMAAKLNLVLGASTHRP